MSETGLQKIQTRTAASEWAARIEERRKSGLTVARYCEEHKPFVMGRKNWLFANTPAGAYSSAVISSIVETAKENGLDPYRYLLYIFNTAPSLDRQKPNWTEPLLPENAPEECKTKQLPRER